MSASDKKNRPSPPRILVNKPTKPSEEFFIRVNDIIESANRIERRHDTHHAELVLLHAFSRYSAHHYGKHVKQDDEEGRLAFASYIARGVEELIMNHLLDLKGPPAAAAPEAEPAAE